MKFSKYHQPKRKNVRRPKIHSDEYIEARRNELYSLMAEAKSNGAKSNMIDAYSITINP